MVKYSIKQLVIYLSIAITAICAVIIMIYYLNKDNGITIAQQQSTNISPSQIKSIEAIGEWEFLTIDCEEMIDTTSYGFFGDSQLINIYYGTLRLGINMHEVAPQWISKEKDTLIVQLPAIKLLDNNFIDEAKTKVFFQTGKWDNKTREKLYQQAYKSMKLRALTPTNITTAQNNASQQFKQLMQAMGHKDVIIRFARPNPQ